jgi:hypothetical protein
MGETMTSYEAAYHYRAEVKTAFAKYRAMTNAACRRSGKHYMLSETCKNEMCDAWTMLKSELAFAHRQFDQRRIAYVPQ